MTVGWVDGGFRVEAGVLTGANVLANGVARLQLPGADLLEAPPRVIW